MDKPATIKELCKLIETAAAHGVSELKYADLSVTFGPKDRKGAEETVYLPKEFSLDTLASQDSEQSVPPQVSHELLEDMRRSQLLIDDPMAFEQEMIDLHVSHGEHNA